MTRLTLTAALALAGCATAQPAPVSYGAPAPPPHAAANETALSAYALQPEEAHPVDPTRQPRVHHVAAGERLSDIAARYQIPMLALIARNRLEPPYALAPGRELALPAPRVHVVVAGETLESVARGNGVDPRSLALFNRLPAPYALRVGDRLLLPATADSGDASVAEESAPAPSNSGAPAGNLAWPLAGRVVVRFGAQPGGRRSDGVEIEAEAGTAIRAAADGEVAYAGADVPGYGTLVLLRHDDGLVTAYARAARALVREGERVRRGQTIAALGERAEGRARLLFQVRRGRQAIDPEPLLGAP